MRIVLAFFFSAGVCSFFSQDSLVIPRSSVLYGMASGDSVVYYQCRVIDPAKEAQFASDYAQPTAPMHSVTDKIVVTKNADGYTARVYKTHIRDLPNRKFSGLKMKERPYWMFEFVRTGTISPAVLRFFLGIEMNAREAIEYDYALSKYTRNQVIVKRGKNFRQVLPQVSTRLVELVK